MRRALASFQLLGVDAVPAATDFEVNGQTRGLDWLPDAEALAASSRALREYLGYVVYRWRGWV
ncbi:MAG: YdcF family protein, partial [Anaerolineae bacterium]|nr:YdcF family protein [Anaerolineae bacterium]